MPIKGLTDRPGAFPEIGSIRKGAPKGEKQPGADLKYFRVEFDEREEQAALAFKQVYRDQPTELNILFPFNEIERNFNAWREAYIAGALIHRCDGEQVWYEIDPKTGEKVVINGDPYQTCDGRLKCRPTGRMKVIIPELKRLAYLVVHTTSIHDIVNLNSQLNALLAINGGRLAGIPLKLRRRPVKISTPSGENGKRARREKWLLSVEADPAWVIAKIESLKNGAMPALPVLAAPQIVVESDALEMDDDDETGAPRQASEPTPAPKAANGDAQKRAEMHITRNDDWRRLCQELANKFPDYQEQKKGKPIGVFNNFHILGAAAKCGFPTVTDDNMQSVIEALAARAAQEKAAG